MKYFGTNQLTDFVQQDINLTNYLADQLMQIPSIEVEPTHPLSILCFRYVDRGLSEVDNEQINVAVIRTIETEGKIFITGTKLRGKTYLRVYYGNPERTKQDVAYMVDVIREAIASAKASLPI